VGQPGIGSQVEETHPVTFLYADATGVISPPWQPTSSRCGRPVAYGLSRPSNSTWRYQEQSRSARHMGPMAADIYRAIGVGEDGRHISAVDADGVALAAIQGMFRLVQAQEATIDAQHERIVALEARLERLERTRLGSGNTVHSDRFWSALVRFALGGAIGCGLVIGSIRGIFCVADRRPPGLHGRTVWLPRCRRGPKMG
jgi:hypothetical protein